MCSYEAVNLGDKADVVFPSQILVSCQDHSKKDTLVFCLGENIDKISTQIALYNMIVHLNHS